MGILKTAKLILDFGIDAIDPSMELFNEVVPAINFRRAVPKLPGMDTSTLKSEGRRTMQLKVDTEKMEQLEKLIDCIKENDLLKPIWGRWVHITKSVNYDSSRGDINSMMQFSKEHTNYQVGMTAGEIRGISIWMVRPLFTKMTVVLNKSHCVPVYIIKSILAPRNHYLQKYIVKGQDIRLKLFTQTHLKEKRKWR